ncbi:MAG: hypothetical protein GY832_40090 [Chloroflexi bacterium]|nr:hypothetical protein [Chloroflexota bacterium]
MNESVLWVIAIGTGILGLLLLAVAGGVAVYWNFIARKPKEAPYTGNLATAGTERVPANAPPAQPTTGNNPLLWIKAWLFAILHAGTVSVVMGGVTFFQDLAKSSEEIQTTGIVTFPKQLLPGTLSDSASRERLSQPSKDSPKAEKRRRPGKASDHTPGWEVIDLVDEAVSDNR